MIKQSIDAIKGQLIWSNLMRKESLDDKKIVLVLTGENDRVDEYALKYLDDVIDRKYAEEALVIAADEKMTEKIDQYTYSHPVKTRILPPKKVGLIHKWYCLDKLFFRNLIFTYVRTNKDNLLERFLQETDVDEEDVVCLALYNLTRIPEKK